MPEAYIRQSVDTVDSAFEPFEWVYTNNKDLIVQTDLPLVFLDAEFETRAYENIITYENIPSDRLVSADYKNRRLLVLKEDITPPADTLDKFNTQKKTSGITYRTGYYDINTPSVPGFKFTRRFFDHENHSEKSRYASETDTVVLTLTQILPSVNEISGVNTLIQSHARLYHYTLEVDKKLHQKESKILERKTTVKKKNNTAIRISDLINVRFYNDCGYLKSHFSCRTTSQCKYSIGTIVLNDTYRGRGNTNDNSAFQELAKKWLKDVEAARKIFSPFLTEAELIWLTNRLKYKAKKGSKRFQCDVIKQEA
jgi:hypothetical protein